MKTRLVRILFYLPLLLLGLQSLYQFFLIALQRLAYPFELEWMEGAMLHQVSRVLSGQSLYGEPTLAFVPALYMPFYYFVSAAVADVVGLDFFALRAVSFTATIGIFAVLFFTAREITGRWLAGVFAVCAYSALFPHTAYWFDVARADSLWTLLLLSAAAALVTFQQTHKRQWLLVSVLAWVMAFFTKQASCFLLPFLGLVVWCWGSFRLAVAYAVAIVLLVAMGLWHLQQHTGEHFLFYTLQMASSHGVTAFGFERFFKDILFNSGGFLLLGVSFLFVIQGSWRQRSGWILLFAGFVTVSMISRAYAGAFFNVLMPFYAALALFAACAYYQLAQYAGVSWLRTASVALLAFWLPFNSYRANVYDPGLQVPSLQDRATAEWLQARVSAVPGRVCLFSHSYIAYKAGKGFCAHNTQVTDLVQGSDAGMAAGFLADARAAILRGDYAVLVLDREKELADLGLSLDEIPYDASPITYPDGKMKFVVNGTSPSLWLQFNPAKVPHNEKPRT